MTFYIKDAIFNVASEPQDRTIETKYKMVNCNACGKEIEDGEAIYFIKETCQCYCCYDCALKWQPRHWDTKRKKIMEEEQAWTCTLKKIGDKNAGGDEGDTV